MTAGPSRDTVMCRARQVQTVMSEIAPRKSPDVTRSANALATT
jgi:hypothetical protein